jgi:small subunit ribosomal protein S12|tara:strand:+ start:132 stop:500 length:369 start_codon:yes stop_codon:yes gene_type:complete
MTRIFQLIKRPRIKRVIKSRSSKLLNNPQKRAVCLKVLTLSPKKPNSANRRVSRIKIIETKQKIIAKIPGEGNNLQQHSTILVKGGRSRDLIGVRYSAIRGKYDLLGVKNRRTSKSIYGVKN